MSLVLHHPAAASDCPHCRGKGIVVRPGPALAEAQLCACATGPCPECGGSGYVPTGDGALKRCVCQRVTHRIHLFHEAGIPARHASSTLTSFRHDEADNMETFASTMRWAKGFDPRQENRGLVLYGKVGRGKTHLMVALLQHLILDRGVSVRFVEFTHLISDMKTQFERREGIAEVLEPLAKVQILAIDELGKGRNTEWEGTVLDEIISRRYNAAATVLATSNYAPGRPTGRKASNAAAPDDPEYRVNLVDRVGDRVYSRLTQMCDFLPLQGKDWREVR